MCCFKVSLHLWCGFKVSCDCVAGCKGFTNYQLPITNYQLPIPNPHRVPKSKPRFHLFTFGRAEVHVAPIWVPQSKPRFYLFAMGDKRRYELLSTSPSGYPKVNQDSVCLLLGERRYKSPQRGRGHRSMRPYCRTRRYHSRNLVTERGGAVSKFL